MSSLDDFYKHYTKKIHLLPYAPPKVKAGRKKVFAVYSPLADLARSGKPLNHWRRFLRMSKRVLVAVGDVVQRFYNSLRR